MVQIFRYIDLVRKAKQGYEKPDELMSEASFAFIESFFIASFILLVLGSGGFLLLGFYYGYLLLKILGFIFLALLVADIIVYFFLKRLIRNLSRRVTESVRKNFRKKDSIEVDAHEVQS